MRGEYEIRDILQECIDGVWTEQGLDVLAAPQIQRNVDQSGRGQAGGGGSDLMGIPWLGVEVKRREIDLSRSPESILEGWWLQCKTACLLRDTAGKPLGTIQRREIVEETRRGTITKLTTQTVVIGAPGSEGAVQIFTREPVLMWRLNKQPWHIRMFGYLIEEVGGGVEKNFRVRCPVEVTMAAFLAYLRGRLLQQIEIERVKGE